MKVRLISLLAMLLLMGCAGVKPIAQEALSQINRIGAVSILEDDIYFSRF